MPETFCHATQTYSAALVRTTDMHVIFEGQACVDCTLIIANDDGSGITDPAQHRQNIAHVGLGKLGGVVMACDDDCEGYFSWSPCDYCGSTLGGERHPIAVLGE